MIFDIFNTNSARHSLLEDYPILSKYGYHDEKIIGYGCEAKIVINSIEELVTLNKEIEHPLIVSADHGSPLSIEIYDGWRE